MNDDRDDTDAGSSRKKLARRQGGAARAGLDREEAAETLRAGKRSGGAVRGARAATRRNAGGRVGGEQVARGGHTAGDRTGIDAALGRGRRRQAVGRARTPPPTGATARTGGGRGRVTGKPGQRTRSGARKAGKKK
jgi:hypothetical protein